MCTNQLHSVAAENELGTVIVFLNNEVEILDVTEFARKGIII